MGPVSHWENAGYWGKRSFSSCPQGSSLMPREHMQQQPQWGPASHPVCCLLPPACTAARSSISPLHPTQDQAVPKQGMLPAHGKAGAGRDGTQLSKKYIFIRKALCRGARLSHTKLIPPTPLDGMQEPEGRPAPSINSASSWPGAAPGRRGGRVASVETSSTPLRHAPAVESCAWRAPGREAAASDGCGAHLWHCPGH